ncbi:MAG: 1,4-alpha-glucan branching protein GlgB [Eubacteriales bacterium]
MAETNSALREYLFHEGTEIRAHEFLGCQIEQTKDRYRYTFRTWAPAARQVSVVGEFCDWTQGLPMRRLNDGGIWELSYESAQSLHGKVYKYKVESNAGTVLKGDPFARFSRGGADGASILWQGSYEWGDEAWLEHRRRTVPGEGEAFLPHPMTIYEVHLASFLRREDGGYLSYREAAEHVLPYVKSMGYTHIELLPLTEHPYDPSWGYQVCGYFAPTSRFGTPEDFKYFVDYLHRGGVGVLMDWVPAHFPKDAWGLYEFDGAPLYEYQAPHRRESYGWGTRYFDLGRTEVRSFLISSALYWLESYHIDGLRVDAVASMLYLDYDRQPGEWEPNRFGTNENLEATAFLRQLNQTVRDTCPDVLMIAEESTSWPGVTTPVDLGGLGFHLKWNMGWANDFFAYLGLDPIYRRYVHRHLNFPLVYAFNEHFVLPISHDEVVYGKRSLFEKMHGGTEEKLRQFRVALLLQMTYPGKKLLFMGCEFGQREEWDYRRALPWELTEQPAHRGLQAYTAALNHFYLAQGALWERDFTPEGFEWLYADECDRNMVAFRRYGADGRVLVVVLSFNGGPLSGIRIPAQKGAEYQIVFETSPGSVCLTPPAPEAAPDTEPSEAEKTVRADEGADWVLDMAPFSGVVMEASTGEELIIV